MRIFQKPENTPLQALLQVVDRALANVEQLEPNRFRRLIAAQPTLVGQYLAICHLHYAANSKELRDTSDQRLHAALERLSNAIAAVDTLVRFRLFPADADQRTIWSTLCEALPNGHFLALSDGSLECLLLTATMPGQRTALHVTRIWSGIGNFDGWDLDIALPINRAQSVKIGRRLDILSEERCYRF